MRNLGIITAVILVLSLLAGIFLVGCAAEDSGKIKIVTSTSLLQMLPHGGSTALRIETGIEPVTGTGQSTFLTASDVRTLEFQAPTICYTGSCKSANPFMLDEGYNTSDFMASAFVHAGCVVFIATPEIQSTCFWREAPFDPASTVPDATGEQLFTVAMRRPGRKPLTRLAALARETREHLERSPRMTALMQARRLGLGSNW